ncbi:uncharacterized protein LOC127263631 [Andrographis paniculata]|uniref:uncharacterized protein LOC127263631 n=1 Tax=Andrographis paniculata TaxID=175694 RepID=UPI0021E81DFE|nr:uncharacterized protein LOC127263631 [Andrographis paniculata]
MSDSGKKATDDDEVEQLLRAAHDDVLLKLNVNSHIARASASAAIDPDLERRFEALKRPQKPTNVNNPAKTVSSETISGGDRFAGTAAAADDLFARFAALKSSIPSHNKREDAGDSVGANREAQEEESEDEVDKVIRWAIDAARLDPSPPSDDDNDTDDEERKSRTQMTKK